MREKRKYVRLREPMDLVYKLAKKVKPQRSYSTFIQDIGGGGIKILAKSDLREGDLLEMEIRIPGLKHPIESIGEVVWFVTGPEANGKHQEAGVRFRDIHPVDLHRILEYIYTEALGHSFEER